MASEPLLDLSTLIENRPFIRVDGETYQLKSPDELSLAESAQFTSWGKELQALSEDPEKVKALEALVGVVCRAALVDMPRAVFERLSSSSRMAIVEVFSGLRLGRRLRLAGAFVAQAAARPTGESSSPASNTSSVETSTGGSTEPRLHS